MQIPFFKYSGTGNDFIIIDDRKQLFPEENEKLVKEMCNRNFGIGSDGLMLLRNHVEFDFEMIFYNPDASRSLCGNGSRCSVHLAKKLGMASESGHFTTTDGVHEYRFAKGGEVEISMKDVSSIQEFLGMKIIDTGSPHLIVWEENIEQFDVLTQGRRWRYHEKFSQDGGINVNFVEEIDTNSLRMRTYERGVEAETLSCGTGVTAAALAKKNTEYGKHQVTVITEGGILSVSFNRIEDGFTDIYLRGPVLRIFEGIYHAGK